MRTLRLAMAQIDSTVGDLDGNTSKIVQRIDEARFLQADLVVFPELAISGYPPEDLLFKSQFVGDNMAKMHDVVRASKGICVIVGFIDRDDGIYNAAAVAHDGDLVGIYHKIFLPNYGVFDEQRYFRGGDCCPVFIVCGTYVGINVCEDIWRSPGPTEVQCSAGAEIVVNISASPFYAGRRSERFEMLASRARYNETYVAYVNMIGGQDELVFDGASVIHDPNGNVMAQGSQFEEQLIVADIDVDSVLLSRSQGEQAADHSPDSLVKIGRPIVVPVSTTSSDSKSILSPNAVTVLDGVEEVYGALVIGTRDYVTKCGFEGVLVALSGGIDSSLVASVAADALGSDNVLGVAMPSRYSSEGSLKDARELAENLNIDLRTVSIEDIHSANLETLAPHFYGKAPDITEENLQSRIRGVLIMALSNKLGLLVLTTGNKSEMAVGYATIYGDMAGGYAVIKDVPKTMVYELAEYINARAGDDLIPRSVIEKAPSAELRPDQKDEDSLPTYQILDPILKAYVEEDRSFDEIVALGFNADVVANVLSLVDQSEYKRRQSPPGIKVTSRNFGRDRRMPLANRYRQF